MARELDEILSGNVQSETPAPEPHEQVETPAEPQGQPRDEAGKFAAKPADTPDEPHDEPETVEADEQPKPSGTVPQKALHEARKKEQAERERADNLQRQLQEMQGQINLLAQQRNQSVQNTEPEQPLDFWSSDPKDFVSHEVTSVITPLQQEMAAMRGALSRVNAMTTYGKDAVEAAEKALNEAVASGIMPGDKVQDLLRRSPDPVGEIVQWHQNTPQVRDAKLREELRAEIMAELQAEQAAQPAPKTTPVMPSNLAGARNVGSRTGPEWAGPQPLNDIFARRR